MTVFNGAGNLRMRVALFNFFCAALLGCMMRLAFVVEIGFMNYRHVLHGHSHVAMLGWGYLAFFTLLLELFLSKDQKCKPGYNRLFWLTQISVLGMLITFPLQGYAVWSIFFSAMHIILSYVFAFHFLVDLRAIGGSQHSVKLARWSIAWMILSTVGIWALGPIKAMGLQNTIWYHLSIQFFLHFQFNGWFVFALLALVFRHLENLNVSIDGRRFKSFFVLIVLSCPLTFALAVAWSNPRLGIFFVNSLGVVLQLVAFLFLLQIFKPSFRSWTYAGRIPVLQWAVALLVVKCILQVLAAVPMIAEMAYTIRNYVLGFLHLLLLGGISLGLLALAHMNGIIDLNRSGRRLGLTLFMIGFVLTELLLFVQGTMFWGSMGFLPHYYSVLFICSLLFPLGIGLLVFARDRTV